MSKIESKTAEARKKRLARVLEDAVHISDRFAREPVYAKTGKGYYKSAGVQGLREDQARLEKTKSEGETSE